MNSDKASENTYQQEKRRRLVSDNRASKDNVYKLFHVQPEKLAGPFPNFREPKEIGAFSRGKDRKFIDNKQQLRYFKPPVDYNSVVFDLRHGYKEAILRDESVKDFLDTLLIWISLNRKCFLNSSDPKPEQSSLNTDFVCWRGLLTKIICTPFENREGWIIAVIYHNGTFYMCEFETDQRKEQKKNDSEKQKEMSYWGYKFEQYLTSDDPKCLPITGRPVNNSEEFGSVIRSRLKSHSFVYAGEVDCCEMTERGEIGKYVELKTSRELYSYNNERNFKKFKLIKWWAQSFLLGVPTIVAGFRDDDGIVRRLESIRTNEIPRMIKDERHPPPWDPCVCFNFLDEFLNFVKDAVGTKANCVHVFRWNPREPIKVEVLPPDSEFNFLPKWYTEGSEVPRNLFYNQTNNAVPHEKDF